jgi:hypothetical protein
MTRQFVEVAAEDLRVGDHVKGNGALWKILGFTPLHNPYILSGGRRISEMVEAECVDPLGVTAFRRGMRKRYVRQCMGGTWEREVR